MVELSRYFAFNKTVGSQLQSVNSSENIGRLAILPRLRELTPV